MSSLSDIVNKDEDCKKHKAKGEKNNRKYYDPDTEEAIMQAVDEP